MLLDRYVSNFDGAVLVLTALYSTDNRYGAATRPVATETDQRWSITYDYAQYSLPYLILTPQKVSDVTVANVWSLKTKEVTEKNLRLSCTAILPAARFLEARDVLYDQKGVIHQISGLYYLCEGGDILPAPGSSDYTVRLSWLEQQGTRSPSVYTALVGDGTGTGTMSSSFVDIPSLASPWYSGNWWRPPWGVVYYFPPSTAVATTKGDWRIQWQYTYDANGFNRVASLFSTPLNPGRLP
jgi:hypothetical protein